MDADPKNRPILSFWLPREIKWQERLVRTPSRNGNRPFPQAPQGREPSGTSEATMLC